MQPKKKKSKPPKLTGRMLLLFPSVYNLEEAKNNRIRKWSGNLFDLELTKSTFKFSVNYKGDVFKIILGSKDGVKFQGTAFSDEYEDTRLFFELYSNSEGHLLIGDWESDPRTVETCIIDLSN